MTRTFAFTAALLIGLVAQTAAHVTTDIPNGLSVHSSPAEPPIAAVPGNLFLELEDATGNPITRLETVHERKLHVFIVGSDLQTFAHLHPEESPNGFALAAQGIYVVNYTYPLAGKYLLVVDYVPSGGDEVLAAVPTPVLGERQLPAPVFDFNTTKRFGAYAVTLDAPVRIESGEEEAFSFRIERDGEPVRDLQPYLGAVMHVFTVRADLEHAGHAHPYEQHLDTHGESVYEPHDGPDVPIRYTFPEPGVYALFGQFQSGGELTTVQFLVHVEPPDNLTDAQYANKRRNANILSQGSEIILFVVAMILLFPLALWLEKRKERVKTERKSAKQK